MRESLNIEVISVSRGEMGAGRREDRRLANHGAQGEAKLIFASQFDDLRTHPGTSTFRQANVQYIKCLVSNDSLGRAQAD